MTPYILHCMLFFTLAPDFSAAEQDILQACEKTYPQLSACDEKLTTVKALSGERYTVIASCGPEDATRTP